MHTALHACVTIDLPFVLVADKDGKPKMLEQVIAERIESERSLVSLFPPMFGEYVSLRANGQTVYLLKSKSTPTSTITAQVGAPSLMMVTDRQTPNGHPSSPSTQQLRRRRDRQLLSVPIDQLLLEYHEDVSPLSCVCMF